jgi:hypothetical protein
MRNHANYLLAALVASMLFIACGAHISNNRSSKYQITPSDIMRLYEISSKSVFNHIEEKILTLRPGMSGDEANAILGTRKVKRVQHPWGFLSEGEVGLAYGVPTPSNKDGYLAHLWRTPFGFIEEGIVHKKYVLYHLNRFRERPDCVACVWEMSSPVETTVVKLQKVPESHITSVPSWEHWMGNYRIRERKFKELFLDFQERHFTNYHAYQEAEGLLLNLCPDMDFEEFEQAMGGIYYCVRASAARRHAGIALTLFMPGLLNVDYFVNNHREFEGKKSYRNRYYYSHHMIMAFGYQKNGVEIPKYCVRFENAKLKSIEPFTEDCFPKNTKTFYQQHF